MDLVFKRYSSPFIFLDELIENKMFSNFINEFVDIQNEEEIWEFFLHKVYDKTFEEFKNEINSNNNLTDDEIKATVEESFNMLNNFIPT